MKKEELSFDYFGYDCFKDAIRRKDIAEVKRFLDDEDYDPSVFDSYLLREALVDSNPSVEIVKLILEDSRVNPNVGLGYPIERVIDLKNLELLKLILPNPKTNPSTRLNRPLFICVSSKWIEGLEVLLADERLDLENDNCLTYVIEENNLEIFKMLIAHPRIDPGANFNRILTTAVNLNRVEMIRLLISNPWVDPSIPNNYAFSMCAGYGHDDVVSQLLKDRRIYPASEGNEALKIAFRNNQMWIVKILLDDERVMRAGFDPELSPLVEEYFKNRNEKRWALVWVGKEISQGWADILSPAGNYLYY